MANKEIKQTIRLEGEKEYSAAIREAQRNLKTLRSELKAETAELGANATAQQKNEARAKSLKAQIEQQEKVVETLKKALAEAKKDYGDNEDVVQKWEQKLNDARTTLANMQNGLADTENAMRGVSDATAEGVTATKSFADALNSISSVGESVSGAIEGIFTGLIGTVRDVVVDLWEMIGDTAAKANNWTDIAGYWNTDPVNVQKWARALDANGKSLEDYEAIVSRLVLGGKNKEITELLGVSDVNYTDEWEYATAVMERISELNKSGNLPENLWETIFGEKRAIKAKDIANSWDAIQTELEEFDPEKGGYGWDAEEQAALDKYYVDMKRLEAKWQALKDEVALGFGTVAADLLINVEGGLDALNEFMNADSEEEREAALAKFRENVEEFFRKIADAIREAVGVLKNVGEELSHSDDPVVAAVGNLLKSLTDAFQWIIDNQDKVKVALEAIFGFWFMAKLAMISGKLASIVAQIEAIKAFRNWNLPGKAAEGASGSGGSGAAAEGAAAAGGGGATAANAGWFARLGYAFELAGGWATALPVAALGAGGYAGAKMVQANLNDTSLNAVYGSDNGEGGVVDTMSEESMRRAAEYFRIYSDASKTGTEEAFDARDALYASLAEDGFEATEQAVSLLEQVFENYQNENDPDGMIDKIVARYPEFFEKDDDSNFFQDAANTINEHIQSLLFGSDPTKGQNGLTSDDVSIFRGLPGMLRSALFSHVNGIKVVMDGETVGRIVMPYVGSGLYKMVTE